MATKIEESEVESAEVKREESLNEDPGQSGRWTFDENLKYVVFLNYFKQKFACRLKRK